MDTTMKMLDLFTGLGTASLVGRALAIETIAMCENDPRLQKHLRRRFPGIPIIGDIKDVRIAAVSYGSQLDLIVGGFPCQDISRAGKRAGLAGEKSGLWFELLRIIDEIRPRWVVIENVLDLLTSGNGRDIQIVIDALTQIGYAVDIDILDAQFFGVPQQRKRVFLTCVRLDDLLSRKTNLSRQISTALLAQQLLDIWGVTLQASSLVPFHSDYVSQTENCRVSLKKRTNLLGLTLERLASSKYQNIWDALLAQFGAGDSSWDSSLIERNVLLEELLPVKDMCESLLKKIIGDAGHLNISILLNSLSEDACNPANKSTTSILSQLTIDQKTYFFAVVSLYTIAHIIPYLDWSPSCWNAVTSVLTLLQENMNYAGQASNCLFVEHDLRYGWRDYLIAASCLRVVFERCIRSERAAEILFEPEGIEGNFATGKAVEHEVAYSLTTGVGTYRGNGYDNLILAEPKAKTLTASGKRLSPRTDTLIPLYYTDTHQQDRIYSPLGKSPALLHGLSGGAWKIFQDARARRLTPTECARLQGFPDDWCDGLSDTAKYEALGNAIAVPVLHWILKRIVEAS